MFLILARLAGQIGVLGCRKYNGQDSSSEPKHSPILEPHLHIPLRHAQLIRQPLPHRIVRFWIHTEPMFEYF